MVFSPSGHIWLEVGRGQIEVGKLAFGNTYKYWALALSKPKPYYTMRHATQVALSL